MTDITALPRGINPMNADGIERDEDGVAHYTDLPTSLLDMFARWVAQTPDAEVVAEVGGERLTYQQLWDRAARVAGGLHDAGVRNGDRVAILTAAGNDWVVAFWGILLAGAVAVPVNTRFAQPEIDYVIDDSGATYTFEAGAELPDGEPYVVTG